MPRRPTQPHGPYWQLDRARSTARPVTRRLTASEAELYRDWIDNDRRHAPVINQMRVVAAKPPNSASPKPANPHRRFNCKLRAAPIGQVEGLQRSAHLISLIVMMMAMASANWASR